MAAALPLAAHHSFSAEFDSTKPLTLEGKVVQMEWVNPHSWLTIDVTKADGTVERWRIEGGSPSVLLRLGWNRNSLPAGTRIKVVAFQAKDGSLRGSSRRHRVSRTAGKWISAAREPRKSLRNNRAPDYFESAGMVHAKFFASFGSPLPR